MQKLEYVEFNLAGGRLVPKLSHQKLLQTFETAKRSFQALTGLGPEGRAANDFTFANLPTTGYRFRLEPAPSYDANGKLMISTDSGEISFENARAWDLAHTLLNGKIGLLCGRSSATTFT